MIDKNLTYAVVGASNNEEKYGHKVLRDLKEAGYRVIPVNPNEKEILDIKCYKELSEIKEKVDFAVFVVPPKVAESVLKEVKQLGIKNVWLQPGSESDTAVEFCKKNDIRCIHSSCIMVERKR